MTASTEAGIEEFSNETGGKHSMADDTVSTPTPPEPDQPEQGTPEKTDGVHPHDSGWPQVHVTVDEQA